MNDKDNSELDIPNFGDVNITDLESEPTETKVEQKPQTETKEDKQEQVHAEGNESLKKQEAEAKAKDASKTNKNTKVDGKATQAKKTSKDQDVKPMPKLQSNPKTKVASKSSTGTKSVAPKQPKGKRKPNYLVIASIVVLAIPCLVLLYIILSSHETKGEPVVGSRFDDALTTKISDEDVTALQSSLQFENTDKVSVNLKSATLRVTIDTADDLSQEQIEGLMNEAYEAVIAKFPVDKYFTNQGSGETTVKMYDLEVSAYNFIPSEEEKASQIHISRTKNAAAESDVVDVLSSAKNAETSEGILNPDTSTPPTQGDAEGE